MKKVYFLSDAHLGSRSIEHPRTHERRLVNFLDSIKHKADAIYLLGDMFDFWYEYKTVVPKGFTRFLGKISELTDMGVEVHFFIGNHDIWCKDYLTKECGIIVHKKPFTTEIHGKVFYMAHGDGLGDPNRMFRFLRSIFHNKVLQRLFSTIHPRWSIDMGLSWASHNRKKYKEPPQYLGEEGEFLIVYSKEYLKTHADINYFIYGHRHVLYDIMIAHTSRVVVLGDWISLFSYAVFDGENLLLEQYIEGESKP